MKKSTKIFALLLSLILLVCAVTLIVGADDAAIEYTYDLAAAVAEAESGSTITLTGNAKIDSAISVDKDLTVDIGNYTVASSAAVAFTIDDSVSFTIVGSGDILLDGELFRTGADNSCIVTVSGSAMDDKIEIIHTGAASKYIAYTYNGEFTYKNLDVLTTYPASTAEYGKAFFHSDMTTAAANVTFDGVELNVTNATKFNPGMFAISVCGDSTLTINDSGINTTASGIYLGDLKRENITVDAVSITNSSIVCGAE